MIQTIPGLLPVVASFEWHVRFAPGVDPEDVDESLEEVRYFWTTGGYENGWNLNPWDPKKIYTVKDTDFYAVNICK